MTPKTQSTQAPNLLVRREVDWPTETARLVEQMPEQGIFLTGIANADPFVDGARRNQLKEAHNFYLNYEDRLEKIADLGLEWLRFGPPYSEAHRDKDQYDFSLSDKVIAKCDQLGITVIADLLHFGLPDWLHRSKDHEPYFQNPYFPVEFARYVASFAETYPQVRYFSLVNGPFVTAQLSAKVGHWNEQLTGKNWQDDQAFVRAVSNLAKAAILARKAILQVWADEKRDNEPIFVQNESFELAFAVPGSNREQEAHRFNLRRFAALDLIFGHDDPAMKAYLQKQGLTGAEYQWFIDHGSKESTILGIDHYPWSIHEYQAEQSVDHDSSKPNRLFDLVEEYWERYHLPMLHTEANGLPDTALELCQQTYDILARLRKQGYPVLGMGWYGDELQIGQHGAMRGPEAFAEYPVGLYYKGQAQPVAELFAELSKKGLPALRSQVA